MTKRAWRQLVRYIKDYERIEGEILTDIGSESEYLYDDSGARCGVNILLSCTTEPKRRREIIVGYKKETDI